MLFQHRPPRQLSLPLSFGIETAIIEQLQSSDQLTDNGIVQAISDGFTLVHTSKAVSEQLDALVELVLARINTLKPEPSKTTFASGKSMGTQYADWLTNLDAEHLCLYLADYDYEQAYYLYWHVDVEVVQDMAKMRSQHDSQRALLSMEACLYGFGGKYEDDSGASGPAIEHDVINDEGAVAALKSFGF